MKADEINTITLVAALLLLLACYVEFVVILWQHNKLTETPAGEDQADVYTAEPYDYEPDPMLPPPPDDCDEELKKEWKLLHDPDSWKDA